MSVSAMLDRFFDALDDDYDIVDGDTVRYILKEFEKLTQRELKKVNLPKKLKSVRQNSRNKYLINRIKLLEKKWKRSEIKCRSTNVFDAIITGDHDFFETKSVPDLLQRLLKSFDKDYNVIDMATILNTISVLEEIDISLPELISTRLACYVERLLRHTTNQYLSNRLDALLEKWHSLWPPVHANYIKIVKY